MILPSPEIWHRNDFSILCNWRKLFRAVEVGVDRGLWAEEFLRHWRGHCYLGIDAWKPYEEMPWDREADREMCIQRLWGNSDRIKLVRADSREMAKTLASCPGDFFGMEKPLFDFVYIDGRHHYEDVKLDIAAWWPLVSGIGILAGHDFDDGHPGVVEAVTEFCEDKVGYLTTADRPPSWYVYKNGIPGKDWVRNCEP